MPRVAFSGWLKSPLSPGVEQAASSYDSPLQFVMYLRNFCLYTNFSPPALTPSLVSPPAPTTLSLSLSLAAYNGPFHPSPAAFRSDIIFNVWKLSPPSLHASYPFWPKRSSLPPLSCSDGVLVRFFVTTCVTRRLHISRNASRCTFLSLSFFHLRHTPRIFEYVSELTTSNK